MLLPGVATAEGGSSRSRAWGPGATSRTATPRSGTPPATTLAETAYACAWVAEQEPPVHEPGAVIVKVA